MRIATYNVNGVNRRIDVLLRWLKVAKVIDELRIANERDPDPADTLLETAVDEPANEWPGAIR